MKRAFGLVFLLVFFFSLWTAGMDEAAASGLPDKLLRLRVIAESDTSADQADKLLVRDAVLAALEHRIADCASLEEARAAALEALPQLAEAAGKALEEAGRPRPLTLRLGSEDCPLRLSRSRRSSRRPRRMRATSRSRPGRRRALDARTTR